jgi:hypothetical protein
MPSVAFHIGAHKTATSHLQRCLANASEDLVAQGVQYFGPQFFRQPGQSVRAVFGLRKGADAQRDAPARLRSLADGADHVVLSEENYIGPLNDPAGKGLSQRYPDAGGHVGALAQALGQDVDVCVGIRQPTTFVNSAYCQMLLSGQVQDFAAYRAANPQTGVDWPAIITDMRQTEGVGCITVWRFEDYVPLFPKIVAALVGAQAGACVPQVRRKINVGLSAAAVENLLQHTAPPDSTVGHKLRGTMPVKEGQPAFDGFTAAEHAASAVVYANQIAAISAMKDVTVMSAQTL